MKNYIQPGKVVTVAAPANVVSGQVVKVGTLIGIAAFDALSTAAVEIALNGVFSVPKDTNLAISEGDVLYWDVGNAWFDKTATGSPLPQRAAKAVDAAGTTAATVLARLTPDAI